MADTKISALTAATAAAGANELPINEAGASKKISVTQLAAYLASIGMPEVLALSANATANATVTGVEITGLNKTVGVGTYVFNYSVRYQSSVTTTGVMFGVNHTGTAAVFAANVRWQESTTAASTGAASQAVTGAGGRIVAGSSTRTKSTTAPNLGPSISVDTINADMLAFIEGFIIVTASGDLELWHASETAASTQVMAGSSLILFKVGA